MKLDLSHARRLGLGLGMRSTCCHFMGELTAQVRISECSNRKTWYEN